MTARRADLLILGGGALGITACLAAVERGLRPVILEAGGWGGGTSAATQRILHGGLRYLQSLDLGRARESIRARRWWMREFPDRTRELPCLLVLDGQGLRRPLPARGAAALERWLSRRRNDGVPLEHRLPSTRVISRRVALERAPVLEGVPFTAALSWSDALMPEPTTLLRDVLQRAVDGGAKALEGVRVESAAAVEGGLVVTATDRGGAGRIRLRAPSAINATAGGWVPEGAAIPERRVAFGVLLEVPPPLPGGALAISPPGVPARFLLDLEGSTLLGTCHTDTLEGPPAPEEVIGFVRSTRQTLPGWWSGEERIAAKVREIPWGLLPVRPGTPEPLDRPILETHPDLPGLVTAWTPKFTTARLVAEEALDRVRPR